MSHILAESLGPGSAHSFKTERLVQPTGFGMSIKGRNTNCLERFLARCGHDGAQKTLSGASATICLFKIKQSYPGYGRCFGAEEYAANRLTTGLGDQIKAARI